ncbi:MAG: choice-of-anchor D domain-containing protein [Verrucomicrobiota bacterium]
MISALIGGLAVWIGFAPAQRRGPGPSDGVAARLLDKGAGAAASSESASQTRRVGDTPALADRVLPDQPRQDAAWKALPQPEQASLGHALFEARYAVGPLTAAEAELEQNRGVRFFASNPGQQMTARFRNDGVSVQSGQGGQWLATLNYGASDATTTSPSADGRRVEYHHPDGVTEWFENGRDGLEHGFILAQRPAAATAGEVRLTVAVGGLHAQVAENHPAQLDLLTPDNQPVLAYGKLKVVDASGRDLPARLEPSAPGLTILVSDTGAVYPLTVDPLITSQEATLTAGDPAAGALFGWSVAVDGDTAVVGAVDEATAAGQYAGSAYVFVRNGANWTRQAKLTASDTAANDQLGWSVALSGNTALIGCRQIAAAAAGKAYIFVRNGETWSQQAKLIASDPAAGDEFGISVALNGDTALVGSWLDDTAAGTDAGSAYVFVRSGTSWTQQTKLEAADTTANDCFGFSVALSGDTALIGALNDDTATFASAGSAYVFVRSGTNWTQQAKLTASDPGASAQFGAAVALSGDTALVGAFYANNAAGANAGSAYVFLRSGTTWTQQAKLTPNDQAPGDWFGAAVALDGDTALVKSQLDVTEGGVQTGSAYVFVRNGGAWTQQTKLVAGDMARTAWLPASVAISGDTVLIGAYMDDSPSEIDSGSASVFLRSGTTWSLQAKLSAGEGAASDQFGDCVAVNGDTALVGAWGDDTSMGTDAGSAYVLVRTGNLWTLQAKLIAGGPSHMFGNSVALNSDTALIGSFHDDAARGGMGSAYVFVRNGTTWSQQAKLTADDGAPNDNFGYSVALDGNTALIGAQGDDTAAGGDAGSAYVFTRTGTVWSQQAHLFASDGAASDQFGFSVSLSGDTALVGAYLANPDAITDAGSAYVFTRSGTAWSQQTKLSASDKAVSDWFGVSVAISGDTALVGAYGANPGGLTDAGSAYVFTRSGIVWTQQAKLIASDRSASDYLGRAVALQGDTALVGAYAADTTGGVNAGSAYVFTRSGIYWTEQAKLTASDGAAYDNFGYAVALSGDTTLVGAYLDDTVAGTDAGSAYVFRLGVVLLPKITVEQPAGNTLATGARLVFLGNALAGTSAPTQTVTVRNAGNANLTGIGITRNGAQAADFTANPTGLATTLAPGAATTFTVTFAPSGAGSRTAALHITSNDPVQNPLDVTLTGCGFVPGVDTDGDGMSDWAKVQLAPLGFNWQLSQPALVQALYNNAAAAGLYTAPQIEVLQVANPLLTRDPLTGHIKVTLALKKSTDLLHWNAFPFTNPGTTVNGDGNIEFDFAPADSAAFFRIESH